MTYLKTICFIGAGNVATHLSVALSHAGYTVNGVFSRHIENARQLAQKLGSAVAVDQLDRLPCADIYIFAVKDCVLEDMARSFSALTKNTDALFVHTAGSMPLSLLSDVFKNVAVLYPMQTFSKKRPLDFRTISVFVEANTDDNLMRIEQIASAVSDKVCELSSRKRKKLHLAAVFACNFSNHCYNLAFNLLENEGVDPTCLLGLIDETTRKIHEISPHQAQTGPAVRWDENVMNEQLGQLSDNPTIQAVYKVMSESIHEEFTH